MVIPSYKMISDLMMSKGCYGFLILCETQQQIKKCLNVFLRNIEGDKQIYYSKQEGFIKNQNNIIRIVYYPNDTMLRGNRAKLIIADTAYTTYDMTKIRSLSLCGFPPFIKKIWIMKLQNLK